MSFRSYLAVRNRRSCEKSRQNVVITLADSAELTSLLFSKALDTLRGGHLE
jgi:hypothetical protein